MQRAQDRESGSPLVSIELEHGSYTRFQMGNNNQDDDLFTTFLILIAVGLALTGLAYILPDLLRGG